MFDVEEGLRMTTNHDAHNFNVQHKPSPGLVNDASSEKQG
jgi:hypothetical protein